MDADTQEHFRCGDCNKAFAKRMDYNRHRKRHDKPYPCSLCEKRFALKTDLDRHRKTHRRRHDDGVRNFKCKFQGCRFRGTTRKDYLWRHLQEKHQDCQRTSSNKTLREYYEEFAREGQTLDAERDLELLEAAKTGDVEKVRGLLSRKANISVRDTQRQTPLELAVTANHRDVAKVLYDHGADGIPMMFDAATVGEEASMKILIDCGVNVNYHNGRNTALSLAVNYRHEKIVTLLLEKGADINIQPWFMEEAALHIAASNSEAITKVLLEANPNVDAKNKFGQTPLSYAVGLAPSPNGRFNQATTKLLLEAGATVEEHHWSRMPYWFKEQNAEYSPFCIYTSSFGR